MKKKFFTNIILTIEIILCFAIGFITIATMNTKIENKPLMIAKTVKPANVTIKPAGSTSTSKKSTSKAVSAGVNKGTARSNVNTASSKITSTASSKKTK